LIEISRANCSRKRPAVSGTERRSSEQTYDDPVTGDVIVAPVGSGDDDANDCATSWNDDDDEDSDCNQSGDVVPSRPRHYRPGVPPQSFEGLAGKSVYEGIYFYSSELGRSVHGSSGRAAVWTGHGR